MFGFLKFFSGGKQKASKKNILGQESKVFAPGTEIPFDPDLVTALKQDHQQLLDLFTNILYSAKSGSYGNVRELMEKFLRTFDSHLLLEYTKLYIYLDYSFKDDEVNHGLIREFRREMNQIGKVVRTYYKKWMEEVPLAENIYEFLQESEEIAGVLVRRIKMEEERLYEIYELCPKLILSRRGH